MNDSSKLMATELVIAAGLDMQHSCMVCGTLLKAYGRKPSVGRWVCPDHKSLAVDSAGPGRVTCATKYEADA